ncbi:FUSC family protein [Clostridium polynesiense]|uniref:FUSC family protein n=1 Tax=Clostridium polynesiense TaxID=1325933 RepID=UPI0006942CCE|nr:aromatic acid exporter family protein [Clostridium polynesiense]
MKINIGLRIYKTAFAIFLCVLISNLLGISAFYPCIAAVISMESTVINSFKAGINRMQGTVLGAVIGLIFSSIKRNSPVLCALGTILIIVFCNRFKWKKSVVISCTVFFAIMINVSAKTPMEYSLDRSIDTFIGIIIAVLVNYLIFPPKIHQRIEEESRDIEKNISEKLDNLAKNYILKEVEDLRLLLDKYSTLVKSLEQEDIIYKEEDYELEKYTYLLKRYEVIYVYLETLTLVNISKCSINKENLESLHNITGEEYIYSENSIMNNEENIIYNYNIRKIIQAFNSILNYS